MIDIIIPVNSNFELLNKTLISVCLQTIKDKINVYVVCNQVNGDECKSYLNPFINKMNIKHLINKNNCNINELRQYGLDNSSGEYVMFVDPGDLLYDCFSLENLLNKINEDNYDMVVGCSIQSLDGNLSYIIDEHKNLYAKLYRREFVNKQKIKFGGLNIIEDNFFNETALLTNPRYAFSETDTYLHYKDNLNQETEFNYIHDSISNICAIITNAQNNGYDAYLCAKLLFTEMLDVYSYYLNNFRYPQINLLFEWLQELFKLYNAYDGILSIEEKKEIYDKIQFYEIPRFSFYDFLNLIYIHQ